MKITMKTAIISLLTVLASTASFVSCSSNTSMMEMERLLQTTGEGFGNDPTACSATGTRFTCDAPSGLENSGNITKIDSIITCDLDAAIGMLFQESKNCVCQTTLSDQFVGGREQPRLCACSVCPPGSAQSVALDCTNNVDDPCITGPCSSLSCDGLCNGTVSVGINEPSPAPGTVFGEETTAAPASAPSAACSPYVTGGIMTAAAAAVALGTVVSFFSLVV